jgi:hypothetical protein
MSASGPAKHGTLKHGGLRIARRALVDGERVRPRYLGKLAYLGSDPGSPSRSRQGRRISRMSR